MKAPAPIRVQILEKGIELTTGDRQALYGEATVNLECAGALINIYQRFRRPRGSGHEAAMLNVLHKISRIACGVPSADNYVDAATYLAIAAECLGVSPNADERPQAPSDTLHGAQRMVDEGAPVTGSLKPPIPSQEEIIEKASLDENSVSVAKRIVAAARKRSLASRRGSRRK